MLIVSGPVIQLAKNFKNIRLIKLEIFKNNFQCLVDKIFGPAMPRLAVPVSGDFLARSRSGLISPDPDPDPTLKTRQST